MKQRQQTHKHSRSFVTQKSKTHSTKHKVTYKIISSIGVLQIKEKLVNGKTTSPIIFIAYS